MSGRRAFEEHGLDLPPEIVYRAYEERWQLVKVNPSVEKMLASLGLDASGDACLDHD